MKNLTFPISLTSIKQCMIKVYEYHYINLCAKTRKMRCILYIKIFDPPLSSLKNEVCQGWVGQEKSIQHNKGPWGIKKAPKRVNVVYGWSLSHFVRSLRPSLSACQRSLIDILLDLLVKLKMVVSCLILELEKNLKIKIHEKFISVGVCFLQFCSRMHDFVSNWEKHLQRDVLRDLLTTNKQVNRLGPKPN